MTGVMDKTPCLTALRLDRALPTAVWGLFEACQGEGVMGVRGVEAQVAREVRFAEKGLWGYARILELQCARGNREILIEWYKLSAVLAVLRFFEV
jgi:hypothetical protein